MKKLLLLLSIFSLSQLNAQQNLVLNPSFEDVSGQLECSFYGGGNFPITNWMSGSISTTDAFSSTLGIICQMHPLNPNVANQPPRTGNNYIGFTNLNDPTFDYREYIRGKLSEPLEVGSLYNIEFYICLTSYANNGMNNFGLVFVNNTEPVYLGYDPIPLQPHVNYSGAPITDRDNWTLMSFQYVPTSANLDSFIIGNFFSSNQTNFQVLNPGGFMQEAYFLIDDVSIYRAGVSFDLVEEICQGDSIVLPNTSLDGNTGTWSPAINNQQTTTYTFVPDDASLPPYVVTIVVKPRLIPTFEPIGPFCDEFPNITELPTISTNGLEGTWSPIFDPNVTKVYTFTPNDTQCNETASITVIVDKTPTFNEVEPFCNYDTSFSLPTISTNGIAGTWSPEFDPYNSQTYTFTRDSGECAKEVTLDIVVHKEFHFDLFQYCKDSEYFVEIKSKDNYNPVITQFDWRVNNVPINDKSPKINLSNYSNLLNDVNTIEVTITDENGCSRKQIVQVLGKYFCKIQKGISPNGDGLNEYFDLASFGGVDLQIFNRYGKTVFSQKNYRIEWKGQSKNGDLLPTGTYFYQFETNVGEQNTGWIQLTY